MHTDTLQSDWVGNAEKRRDLGIARSLTGEGPEWPTRGACLLDRFLAVIPAGGTFLVEQLHQWAGSERPRNGKAWGGVIQRAARAGKIVKVGYAPALSSNHSPKCLWRGVG